MSELREMSETIRAMLEKENPEPRTREGKAPFDWQKDSIVFPVSAVRYPVVFHREADARPPANWSVSFWAEDAPFPELRASAQSNRDPRLCRVWSNKPPLIAPVVGDGSVAVWRFTTLLDQARACNVALPCLAEGTPAKIAVRWIEYDTYWGYGKYSRGARHVSRFNLEAIQIDLEAMEKALRVRLYQAIGVPTDKKLGV